ncbi:unnamed protein product [Lota lota]
MSSCLVPSPGRPEDRGADRTTVDGSPCVVACRSAVRQMSDPSSWKALRGCESLSSPGWGPQDPGLALGPGALGCGASGLRAPGLYQECLDRCERSLGLAGGANCHRSQDSARKKLSHEGDIISARLKPFIWTPAGWSGPAEVRGGGGHNSNEQMVSANSLCQGFLDSPVVKDLFSSLLLEA